MLELCGVSSLPFAVGVYVPIQYSTPIFIGGIVRWGVDWWMARSHAAAVAEATDPEAKARAEIEAIRKSETSSGVLLASGFIAGGSLAGMLLAFTNFSDQLPIVLTRWQYRTEEVSAARSFHDVADEIGRHELQLPPPGSDLDEADRKKLDGFVEELKDLNSDQLDRYAPVPRGTKIRLVNKRTYTATTDTTLGAVAEEMLGSQAKAVALMKCNRQELLPYVKVAKGESVRLPDYRMYSVGEDTTLGSLAEKVLGSSDAAAKLLERNPKLELPGKSPDGFARLTPARDLPPGAKLKLPQRAWPATMAFALLVLFMAGVGGGFLLKTPPEEEG